MKGSKTLLITLLVLFGVTHVAFSEEWSLLHDSSERKIYYNFDNVVNYNNHIVRIWSKETRNNTDTSTILEEYNCKEKTFSIIQFNQPSGPIPKNILDEYLNQYVQPSDVRQIVLNKVCKTPKGRSTVESDLLEWDEAPVEMIKGKIYKDFSTVKQFGENVVVLFGEAESLFQKEGLSAFVDKLFSAYIPGVKKEKVSNPFAPAYVSTDAGGIWLRIWVTKGNRPAYQVFMKTHTMAPNYSTIWQREVIGYGDKTGLELTIKEVVDKMMKDMATEYQKFR